MNFASSAAAIVAMIMIMTMMHCESLVSSTSLKKRTSYNIFIRSSSLFMTSTRTFDHHHHSLPPRQRPRRPRQPRHLRKQMLNHDILTREEELNLGKKIVRMNAMKGMLKSLMEEKAVLLLQEEQEEHFDHDIDDDDMTNLSISARGADLDGLERQAQEWNDDNIDDDDIVPTMLLELDLDDRFLTDDEIRQAFKINRQQLREYLVDGIAARNTLIRNNIRLVVSIAKRWAKHQQHNKNIRLVDIYNGSWNTPSLDEAIQEGILGLAQAADRYDPQRGLRFSTYATHWVTNYVRNCFHDALTGSLRVPQHFHEMKRRFKVLLKEKYAQDDLLPPLDDLAKELNISPKRLKSVLRATQTLRSMDAPLGRGYTVAGKAGGPDTMDENQQLLSQSLPCSEPLPEDHVELSFLRQCLENAMATELSPHERDVLRLRLGLDDGVTRTAREVAEVCGGAISVTEVRTTEQRAFKKLRSPYALHTYQLLAYLDFAGIDSNAMKTR